MFGQVAFLLCFYHLTVHSALIGGNTTPAAAPIQPNSTLSNGVDTNKTDLKRKFSIDELLTTTFPKKTSNDTGLNPCKADVFLDDIAITFEDSRKRYRDSEDDQEKHKLISENAKKILEKKKIWKTGSEPITNSHRIQKRAAATTIEERLWNYGIIPYEIDENWSSWRKALARQAMKHWENHTCLKFVERNKSENVDYVYFTEKPCGCCSFVGRRGIGAQALSIGESCAKFGIIVHEIGHAIGYYHEHTRPDRDNYVQVFEENIVEGQENNFNKLPNDQVTSLGLKYDYDSIMHYARNTYSINGFLDTIQPVGIPQGKKPPEIGQRIGLSSGDIAQTVILYNCPKCGRTFQTKSGQFASPSLNSIIEQTLCEWRIMATPGEKVILNVTSMDIFQSTDCSSDYLEIRDGYWKNSKLLGRFCGTGDIYNIKSDSNRMLVTYAAENVKEHKGFVANFEVVCGGTLEIDSESYLASPNYPDEYYPNKECIWKISVPNRYKVAIKFVSFDIEHHVECRYDFVSIHNGLDQNATLVSTLCGSITPEHLISDTNEMTVRFSTDKSTEKGGFLAKIYAEYNECNEIEHGCEQLCINTLGSYMCGCNLGFELHSDKRSCVDACGGRFKSPNGTLTSPSFPELYPSNKRCIWEIEAPEQHVVFFNFTHLDIEGNNYEDQVCDYDQVNVSSLLSNGKIKLHGSYCGTRKPNLFSSETNLVQITFGSDDTIQKTGFAAIYFIDFDECATANGGCQHDCINTLGGYHCSCRTGFTLDENKRNCIEGDCVHKIDIVETLPSYGTVNSPNYPKYYPAAKDCVWQLRTVPGHRIRLIFFNFNLESHPQCLFDDVQIFDGDTSRSHQVGRYCGSKIPDSVESTDNHLYMTFSSDNNVNKKGFWAKYYAWCGGILQATQKKRQIYSHTTYGNTTYPPMRSCDWFIIGNAGYNIKVTFKEFDLEIEEECSYDFLEVFDGLSSEVTKSLGRYCGNQTSNEVISNEEGLVLKFRADDRIAGQGFILEYEIVESIYSLEEYDTPLE